MSDAAQDQADAAVAAVLVKNLGLTEEEAVEEVIRTRPAAVPTLRSQSATTWFGGYAGAIDLTYGLLHLLRDGEHGTFCNCSEILAPATKRALNKAMWCEVCVREAQEVRRDA